MSKKKMKERVAILVRLTLEQKKGIDHYIYERGTSLQHVISTLVIDLLEKEKNN